MLYHMDKISLACCTVPCVYNDSTIYIHVIMLEIDELRGAAVGHSAGPDLHGDRREAIAMRCNVWWLGIALVGLASSNEVGERLGIFLASMIKCGWNRLEK